MAITEIPADSLTELSYGQLASALATSTATYRIIYRAFIAAAEAVALGIDAEENAAEMCGHLAACEAQAAMTKAILAEIGRRDAPVTRGLASCGHPADEDGECSCSSWPERAPHV